LGRAIDPLRREPDAAGWDALLRDCENNTHRNETHDLPPGACERSAGCSSRRSHHRHRSPRDRSVKLTEAIKGRGASWNPQNRFEKLEYIVDDESERDPAVPKTIYLRDPTRTIIAYNDSPDVGFEASVNPY